MASKTIWTSPNGEATLHCGDCLAVLRAMPDASVHCCVTSPPYWGLRDYGVDGQLGLEPTPDEYVAKMVAVFREVRRVLRDDGTLWLNLGDSYTRTTRGGDSSTYKTSDNKRADISRAIFGAEKRRIEMPSGLKPKDLVGIPWRVAFALQADGWYLRQDIIWHKPNPMPESVRDRCTKAHEYVFLMAKSERYHFDAETVKEASVGREKFGNWIKGQPCPDRQDNFRQDMTPTTHRNRRSVWTISPKPFKGAHFAVMPPALVEPCVKAGCPVGGTVLDPFNGAGTTGVVAVGLGRKYVGIELNPEYASMSQCRIEHAVQLSKPREL